MKKVLVVLEGSGGPLDRVEVEADSEETVDEAIQEAIEDWTLSVGDTIKIREPGWTED